MKSEALKKVFIIFLIVYSGIFFAESKANGQTATARFWVALNEIDIVSNNNNKGESWWGCYISALENEHSETLRYLTFNDVSIVAIIITGEGISAPITLPLTKSSSGYYGAVQSNLPAGVSLNFKTEAKDSSDKIIAQAESGAILEANKITDIFLTLYPVSPEINVPVVVLKTTDSQIPPNKTAKIEIIISGDGQVLCDISHSAGKGSLSNSGGLITLLNGTRTIETVLTPDTAGNYSDTITVKVDDQEGGVAVNKITITIQSQTGEGSFAVNFAPFINSLTVNDNGDGTMVVTAEVDDEKPANLVFLWGGDITIVGSKNSNPITIQEPSNSTYAILTVTDEKGAQSSLKFFVSPNNLDPIIQFTYVPPFGSYNNLLGVVRNVNPANYRVAVYIKVEGIWWTKPYFNSPTRPISTSGAPTWECDITTGGNDQDASHIAAFLIPSTYSPAAASGSAVIPQEVYDNAVAHTSVAREVVCRKITFSGYEWQVKTSTSLLGPGPNYFSDSEQSVWVDGSGYLHLKIAYRNGKWECSEVICQKNFGYGKYIFYLASRVDQLDKNVILGLFTWDTNPAANNREIDIEFAKWGGQDEFNSQYVVQPYYNSGNMVRFTTDLSSDVNSVHFFEWSSSKIFFKSVLGSSLSGSTIINSYDYTGPDNPTPGKENPRINLWLMNGLEPSDGQNVEMVIKKFEFVTL